MSGIEKEVKKRKTAAAQKQQKLDALRQEKRGGHERLAKFVGQEKANLKQGAKVQKAFRSQRKG